MTRSGGTAFSATAALVVTVTIVGAGAFGISRPTGANAGLRGLAPRVGEAQSFLFAQTSLPAESSPNLPPSESPVAGEWRELIPYDAVEEFDIRQYREAQRRMQACMRSRGFSYQPIEYVSLTNWLRMRNPLNEDTALRYGYHVPPVPAAVDPNEHTPAFDEALGGPDTDIEPDTESVGSVDPSDPRQQGCAWEAYEAVYTVTGAVNDETSELISTLSAAISEFLTSDEGQAVTAAWSDCMGEQGYDFDSPQDGVTLFGENSEVTADEIAARTADLDCDRSVGMTQSRSNWERERFEQWRSDFGAQWSELLELIDAAGQELTELESEELG